MMLLLGQVRLHCIVTCRPAASGWAVGWRSKPKPAAAAPNGDLAAPYCGANTLKG